MYSKSSEIYDRVYQFRDWAAEHAKIRDAIHEFCTEARTLLEAGCGTGRYLELFAKEYETTGFDINPAMVELSRKRCPQCRVFVADFVNFELEQKFDVVTCLFSSIAYVRTARRLRSAVNQLAKHVNPDGLLIIEPYFTPEQHWDHHQVLNVAEDSEGKIAWMYVDRRRGNLSCAIYHYLVSDRDQVRHFTERHVMGLFTSEQYEDALTRAGVAILARPEGPGRGVYLCRKH